MNKVLTIIVFFITNVSLAQDDWRLKINDEWFRNYGINGLQVGDRMPDIELGKVVNNYTGKTRFSEFNGKLIILDFWNTTCASCIGNFPKMENIQKEFGSQIQVFLVNPFETQEMIEASFKETGKYFPNLPSIVATVAPQSKEDIYTNTLQGYFAMRGVPHYVIINPEGIICGRIGLESLYPKNIKDILEGKPTLMLSGFSTAPYLPFDNKTSYNSLLGNFQTTKVSYGSFVTPYNNEVNGISKSLIKNIVDSSSSTIRTTAINVNLIDLFTNYVFEDFFRKKSLDKAIYWVDTYYDFIHFSTDTLNYTSYFNEFPDSRKLTTEELIQSKYCYEQILPMNCPENVRVKYAKEDINRFIRQRLGVEAVLEKVRTKCYVLVRKSGKDKISFTGKEAASTHFKYFSPANIFTENGVKMYRFNGGKLKESLNILIGLSKEVKRFFTENKNQGKPYLLFDETGFEKEKRVNLVLPHHDNIKSLSDIRKALQKYDLDIIEAEREIEFLRFKKIIN